MEANSQDLSKLLSSASLVFVGAIISSTASLLERVVVARLLAPDPYGEFSIALAIFTLSTTLGVAGFTQGVPRYMARFENPVDVRGAWLTGLVISVILSSAITIALILGAPVIVPGLFESTAALWVYYAFAITIPLYSCFVIGVGAIRGLENTLYKILTQDLGYPLLKLGLLAIFLTLGIGLVGTGLAYLGAIVAVVVLTYMFLNRLILLPGPFRLHTRTMTAFSLPLIVSTIMSVLLTRTDTLMLGYFRSSSEVGIYNAAYPLAGILTVVLGAFGYMYLPVASRIDSEEEGSVERVYEVTTKWIYLIIFPAFVTLLVFPHQIVSIVFGTEYSAGGAALSILAIGFFTNAAVGRNRETLSALGATTFILVSNVVAFIINFVLNLVLIPLYGFMGAAVASASSFVALNFVVYLFLRSQFGITPFNRRSKRVFIALPVVLIPVGFLVQVIIPSTVPGVFVFVCMMTVLTIVLVVVIQGLEPEDEVIIDFVEDTTGLHIPIVRDYIPNKEF